jgi:hypothetical protein
MEDFSILVDAARKLHEERCLGTFVIMVIVEKGRVYRPLKFGSCEGGTVCIN